MASANHWLCDLMQVTVPLWAIGDLIYEMRAMPCSSSTAKGFLGLRNWKRWGRAGQSAGDAPSRVLPAWESVLSFCSELPTDLAVHTV